MQRLGQTWLQSGALMALSAELFYAFFLLNEWLMASLEHSQRISWLFLPAGLRVVLPLVMGLPGALGIVLGSWAVGLGEGQTMSWVLLGNGLISGLTPWLLMRWLLKCDDMRQMLPRLTALRLVGFVLGYAVTNALLHHLFWWLMSPEPLLDLQGIVPMTVGDAMGALVLLYLLKWMLDRWPLPTPDPR